MGDDTAVRRLVEILSAYYTEGKTVEEDLECSLTCEFLANVQDVLFAKQIFVLPRCESYLDICPEDIFLSPEMYLIHVFHAMIFEAKSNFQIFDRFLVTFAFLLRSCIETRSEYGVNFCKLVPDVFMVFYEKDLKKPFKRCKGLHRFIEFINDPKYLESECVLRDVAHSYDPNEYDYKIPEVYQEKYFQKIRRAECEGKPEGSDLMSAEVNSDCKSLAKKVLEITKTEFIPSMTVHDLNVKLPDLVNEKVAKIKNEEILEKTGTSELTFEHCPNLNFDPKTKDDASEQMADNARCENVIEAVIRYNRSKNSRRVKTKDHSQPEEVVILEHLKCKIESLIEVLEKCDQG